jgi:hypothetical protein
MQGPEGNEKTNKTALDQPRGQLSGEGLWGQRIEEAGPVRSGRVQVKATGCVAKAAG